jgi:hypothetical protein
MLKCGVESRALEAWLQMWAREYETMAQGSDLNYLLRLVI